MTPISLPANVPPRFYRGGAAIAAFRGMREEAQRAPEDWIASTTALFGGGAGGLSLLPDGRTLRDAIQADPIAFLGPERVAEFGPDLGLLVKLLDAGERLPVHVHPDRSFASRHLGCRYGKTEGWVVLGTSGSEACVYLGFREPVPAQTLTRWVDEQDEAALLGALHRIPVAAGDTVLVPAGVPHAIGAGVFVLELQEPTDLSVLLEWKGYDLADPAENPSACGSSTICAPRRGWTRPPTAGVCSHRKRTPTSGRRSSWCRTSSRCHGRYPWWWSSRERVALPRSRGTR